MNPQRDDHLRQLFGVQAGSPDIRVRRCLEAFRAALEQHDCELQIIMVFQGDKWQSNINIVPRQLPES